jgi:hypothetical protein
MDLRLKEIKRLSQYTRVEFEKGAISEDEMIESAIRYSWSRYSFPVDFTSRPDIEKELANGKLREHEGTLIPVPLFLPNETDFPKGYCNIASPVLAQRIHQANIFEELTPTLIHGGYGEYERAYSSYSRYPHTFIMLGRTSLSEKTIVDITADQFDYQAPSVYVGPLQSPWTDNPNFEDLDTGYGFY